MMYPDSQVLNRFGFCRRSNYLSLTVHTKFSIPSRERLVQGYILQQNDQYLRQIKHLQETVRHNFYMQVDLSYIHEVVHQLFFC